MSHGVEDRAFRLSALRYRGILDIEGLDIQACKVSAIVGPSGSGKTTLLRMLNRMSTPESGQITFMGRALAETDPVQLRRRVVMLAQAPVIFPGTVEENLRLGCRVAEKEQPEGRALQAMLKRVDLPQGLDAAAETLSGGEKQRLALARVMLMDPEVLLLDEPSASLDEGTEQRIFGLVTEYSRERCKTLVMVTHSEREFTGYWDVLIRIEGGRVRSVRVREEGP